MDLKKCYRFFINPLLFLTIFAMFFSCDGHRTGESVTAYEMVNQNDLERIKEMAVLKVVIDYNSTNYFIYRGQPMGYQYELIEALCIDLGVQPEFSVTNDLEDSFEGLKSGLFDLVAMSLTVTRERKQEVDFTVPLKNTSQVVVQRRPTGINIGAPYLKSPLDLAGKKVYVQKNSSYFQRLLHLSEEIGSPIHIVEDTINGVEKLVSMVAGGEIDYTVCDEDVAEINRSYFSNLDISLKISFPQHIAWAVRKGSTEWRRYLNHWIDQFQKSGRYKEIYQRYFVNPRVAVRYSSEYHSASGGKISQYDPLVRELAKKHGWDWRLISSIMYHESTFDPAVESWGGAIGLMQLMPSTAEALGVSDLWDPRQNIEGGILFLNWLDEQLLSSIPDSTERIRFVLAAYNIGLGHVKDAQRLARKYGKESNVWEGNVDFYLKNKSSETYFQDPVVRWGYCRGDEAYNFVIRVVGNYQHYLNLIPE